MPRPKLARPNFKLVRIEGRDNWYIAWTENGRSRIVTTRTDDREEAEAERQRFQEEWLRPKQDATVGQLIDAWLENRKHRASYLKLKSFAKEAKRGFGALLPSQINEGVVARYIQSTKHKPTMARRALEVLTFATKIKTERPAKRPPRERYMAPDEVRTFLKHCQPQHLRIFVHIALHTGARHRAILGLTWDRVDLKGGILDFREPDRLETKKRRAVCHVDPALTALLRRWRPFTKNHVIEWDRKPLKDIGHAFRRAAREAKMPWVTPHVLKHTAISTLANERHTIEEIADYTATSAHVVKRIYRKVNPESLRGMASTLARVFATESDLPPETVENPHKKQKKLERRD